MHWWPRHTPRIGMPAAPTRRTTSLEIPASAGEQGPGEMITWDGARSRMSSTLSASLRWTGRLLAQLADVARQVVDEGVVVVDEQDHDTVAGARASIKSSGLVERFPILQLRIGVGHDPAAGLEVYLASRGHHGSDDDARIHAPVCAEVADGAAVDSPARRLQLRDDLHRADLGGAGDGPAGKGGAHQVHRIGPRLQRSHHGRHQVVHRRVVLQREQLGHPHRPRPAHPAQVVPQQVHDHDVLGPVLLALRQRASQRGIVHGNQPARPGSLDRPGLHLPVAVEPKEALGGHAEHRDVVEAEIGGEGRGVLAAEAGGTARTAASRSGA